MPSDSLRPPEAPVDASPAGQTTRRPGGLYARVTMSVRTANLLVALSVALLVAVTAFLIGHNGFTVSYDTLGGSDVASSRVMHAETVSPETPTREDYTFTGWYLDRACTVPFDPANEPITGSLTLYAGWQKTP